MLTGEFKPQIVSSCSSEFKLEPLVCYSIILRRKGQLQTYCFSFEMCQWRNLSSKFKLCLKTCRAPPDQKRNERKEFVFGQHEFNKFCFIPYPETWTETYQTLFIYCVVYSYVMLWLGAICTVSPKKELFIFYFYVHPKIVSPVQLLRKRFLTKTCSVSTFDTSSHMEAA